MGQMSVFRFWLFNNSSVSPNARISKERVVDQTLDLPGYLLIKHTRARRYDSSQARVLVASVRNRGLLLHPPTPIAFSITKVPTRKRQPEDRTGKRMSVCQRKQLLAESNHRRKEVKNFVSSENKYS
jgi:type III secretory pathway component EscU